MTKIIAFLLSTTLLLGAMSCTKTKELSASRVDSTAKEITLGFIYVGGKDDYGYNQAHAEGAAALKKIPGVKVYEEENVPETIETQNHGIDDQPHRVSLMFPVFWIFDPHILAMAKNIPMCFSALWRFM
jgi:simple sugar transport system substrate-binding protein